MALSDIIIPSEDIAVGKSSFSVRGLNADDVAHLFLSNRADVERFAALWQIHDGEVTQDFIAAVLKEVPALVAQAIACAADEPAEWEKARKLSIPVQLQAINAVGRLTFEGVGVKKFLEGALLFMQGMTAGFQELSSEAPTTGTGG